MRHSRGGGERRVKERGKKVEERRKRKECER